MKHALRKSRFTAMAIGSILVVCLSLSAWGAEPTGAARTAVVSLDQATTATAMPFVPGEACIVRVTIRSGTTHAPVGLGQYTTYSLIISKSDGTQITSKTMTKESPVASGIVAVALSSTQTIVTRDAFYGFVRCMANSTSGPRIVKYGGPFRISPASISTQDLY